ncbi:MAG: undecaprenyl/decaprenyl-phosphate alpha-N-acetylglucosaminyl 1-phosphate transferase [Spirochaetales bacterium]|nr:undecaprenyl/decaprenyl-phosphate alpha-N-acetylglucosaminyl 1-phosphate transferase [Spirochaetales bacterium]
MNDIKILIISVSVAFVANLIITPLIIFLSRRFHWYDHINDRKIHEGQIPRLGGVGIFLSFIIGFFIAFFLSSEIRTGSSNISLIQFLTINAAFVIIFAVGLLDDFTNISARYKLIAQIIAAGSLVAVGFHFRTLYIPFFNIDVNLGFTSYIITFFWFIGICNSVNLIDGMDGLAGGTSFFSLLFLGILSAVTGDVAVAFLAFILMGAILGFLVFNFPPAKIFMGDCGSLFLGITLAAIPLIGNTSTGSKTLLISITILMIPIIDTLAAIIRRTIIKRVHFFNPDREHLHHKLLDLGFSVKKILALIYSTLILLGLTTLIWAKFDTNWSVYLILASWVIVVGLYNLLSFFHRKHLKKANQKSE